MKNQKGITLIALIVTVIIMAIIAAASISILWGQDNMIQQVQNAVNEYKTEAERTQNELNTLEGILNNYTNTNS